MHSSAVVELLARGVYLMNGGDPDNWDKMTPDEVQLIYITHQATLKARNNDMLQGLVDILKAIG